MKSVISVIKSTPETAFVDIKAALVSAGVESALDKHKTTILKDNISWHFPYLSANTTPWQLEGVIRALKELGFSDLSAVHNNTVVTNARKGQRLNKLAPIYKKYGVQELMNFAARDMEWITFTPKARMLVLDRIFPRGIKIPAYFMDKNIIHLPTMKTHIYTTTTGAMKNAFGGLLTKKRHYTHSVIHETLVDLLAIQKEIHAGLFALMDGTISGSGPGPRTMTPHDTSLFLASADQVAIDAVAARIMGFDPMSITYIRMAAEHDLGASEMHNMTIVGEDIASVNLHYTVGDNLASRFGDLLWFSPLKVLQKLFFHTPLVYLFVFGSFLYHDYFWWPLIGKRRQRILQRSSEWSRFFAAYPSV